MMHGWQSDSTHAPKGGRSCVFWECLQWSRHPQLLDVVWRSAVVVVLVV